MTDAAADFPLGLVLFRAERRIAQGTLEQVRAAAAEARSAAPDDRLLAFDLATGRLTDLDYHAPAREPEPEPAPEPARRGRPKLGVVAREVTLLPRHWDWLAQQPGGASVTLRRLVEQARKADAQTGAGDQRRRREAAYRFMSAMAGDAPGFEEASRALFAGERGRLTALMAPWPADIVATVLELLGADDAV
ncbi:DUF2239 family protein [Phenylobacterium sp.]|uniref:DUF2239 family protein n=1 Tax=Phenylobacterium sp. TaxID=1871053 RepID=UPI00273080FE|nr:DUF2239 family protein [Phenylobacterium sp.]MDP2212956.1 DUF2239 family protein [Phenylobacterium sp.]